MSLNLRPYYILILLLIVTPSGLLFSKGKEPTEKGVSVPETQVIEISTRADQSLEKTQQPLKPAETFPQSEYLKEEQTADSAQQTKILVSSETKVEPKTVPQEAMPSQKREEKSSTVSNENKIHAVWIWQETKDCLWQLAKQYYGDPWKWKIIYLANRNTILDPTIIYPKQKIIIPPLDEK